MHDLSKGFLYSAKGLRELHLNCRSVICGTLALQGLLLCDTKISPMFEKLSLTYDSDFLVRLFRRDIGDEEALLDVPPELFDENAQITHTKTMSEGRTTHIWSVGKGEKLLKGKLCLYSPLPRIQRWAEDNDLVGLWDQLPAQMI